MQTSVMSSSWFLVWVPSRSWERENTSFSKSRCSEEFVHDPDRSRRWTPRDRSSSATSSLGGNSDVEESKPPFRFNEERPVLKSLPAIQEDQDPHLTAIEPIIRPGKEESKQDCSIEAENPPSEEGKSARSEAVANESAAVAVANVNQTSSTSTDGKDGPCTGSPSPKGEPAIIAETNRQSSEETPNPETAPDAPDCGIRKTTSYTVTIIPEENTVTTATTPISDATQTSLHSPHENEEKLQKQESYDSHVRRGPGDQFTPCTPSNPTLPDDREVEKSTMAFLDWEPMEDLCRKLLDLKKISPVSVQHSLDKTQVLFSFCVPYDLIELILLEFHNQGIGQTSESSISVVPSSVHYSTHPPPVLDEAENQDAKMDRFYSSVKSRLLVAEVIARIQAGAEFSFDFLLLLILAGLIAVMGLVENSSVVLVASMLVSPLMGPILAGIFGGVVQDNSLTWKGIRHEAEALMICILIGLVTGLMISPWAEQYGCQQWPTPEMLSRGELRALWVGVLIAVPSGAGVALSVLGGNAGSLVGVAISASLLPPAVNAGLFWALSIVLAVSGNGTNAAFHGFGTEVDPETNLTMSLYEPRYSSNYATESFVLGLTSLALTLINILCIILTGVLILRLKEVTPAKIPQKFSDFWRKDIKAHRNYYKTLKKEDNQKLLNELRAVGLAKTPNDGLEGTFLQSMFERATQDSDLINIKEWVSLPPSALPPSTTARKKPKLIINEDEQQLLSPNSNTTLDFSGLGSAPVRPENGREFFLRRGSSKYKPYATFHHSSYTPTHTFLNVPNFFQSEIRRSGDFRHRIHSKSGSPKPTNV